MGNFMYLWVAERQAETKRIHFHLISNKYFPIAEFNALWVLQQYNAGITHPLYSLADIHQASPGELQKKLNPVDVKAVNSVGGLSIYLTMYVVKNKDVFECRTWHCCRLTSALFTTTLITQDLFNDLQVPEKNYSVNIKTGEIFEAKLHVSKHALVIPVLNKQHFHKNLKDVTELNEWIVSGALKKEYYADLPVLNYFDLTYIFHKKEKTERTAISIQSNGFTKKTSKNYTIINGKLCEN